MKLKIIKLLILLIFAGSLYSCKKKDESLKATGTIIGSYYCASSLILVQVDEEYPIGEPYRDAINVIQVQWYEYISCIRDLPTNEILNKRISFSYRVPDVIEMDTDVMFNSGPACPLNIAPPILPCFVITKCQILK